MPTYDYYCLNCSNEFEKMNRMSEVDKVKEKCPLCNGPSKRLISGGTGIIFKGPGFYCNDYPKRGCSKKECATKEKEKSRSVEDIQKGKYPD